MPQDFGFCMAATLRKSDGAEIYLRFDRAVFAGLVIAQAANLKRMLRALQKIAQELAHDF